MKGIYADDARVVLTAYILDAVIFDADNVLVKMLDVNNEEL